MNRNGPTHKALADETLYCERCGISFLWPREERSAPRPDIEESVASPRPRLCPGCRKLLPQANRERGLVKWYDGRKRYGFIGRSGHDDVFVHRSELLEVSRLQPGDLVEFAVVETDRGIQATGVRLLAREDKKPRKSNES